MEKNMCKKLLCIGAVTLMCTLMFVSSGAALKRTQAVSVRITGSVYDLENTPVPDAQVTIGLVGIVPWIHYKAVYKQRVLTDAAGQYDITLEAYPTIYKAIALCDGVVVTRIGNMANGGRISMPRIQLPIIIDPDDPNGDSNGG